MICKQVSDSISRAKHQISQLFAKLLLVISTFFLKNILKLRYDWQAKKVMHIQWIHVDELEGKIYESVKNKAINLSIASKSFLPPSFLYKNI